MVHAVVLRAPHAEDVAGWPVHDAASLIAAPNGTVDANFVERRLKDHRVCVAYVLDDAGTSVLSVGVLHWDSGKLDLTDGVVAALQYVTTRADVQRRGLASAVIGALVNFAYGAGVDQICARVQAAAEASLFFARRGFAPKRFFQRRKDCFAVLKRGEDELADVASASALAKLSAVIAKRSATLQDDAVRKPADMVLRLRCTARWTSATVDNRRWRWHRQMGPTCGFVLIHALIDQWCQMIVVSPSDDVDSAIEAVAMLVWREAWSRELTVFGEIDSNEAMVYLLHFAWAAVCARCAARPGSQAMPIARVVPISDAARVSDDVAYAVGFDRDPRAESKIICNGGESAHWGLVVAAIDSCCDEAAPQRRLVYLHGQSSSSAACDLQEVLVSNAQCLRTTLVDESTFAERPMEWKLSGYCVEVAMGAARSCLSTAQHEA